MEPAVLFEKKGKTAYVILNRPEQRNAINLEIREKLCESWTRINKEHDIWCAIITGGEKVFSTGQDLAELSEFRKKDQLSELPFNTLETLGVNIEKPVIGAISGYCLGFGFFLTMVASDIRIASTTTRFGMPEVKLAVPPSLGIPAFVAKHFTPAMAMELLMLGKNITAEDAYRSGFVNRIVPPEALLGEAEAFADMINQTSPVGVKNIKEVFKKITAPDPKDIALSNAVCLLGRHSEDYLEGPRAFREKRKPVWKGR